MVLSIVASLLSVIGAVPYVRGIVGGRVRPERMTWFIWSVVLALALLGYRASGSGDSWWFVAAELATNTAVFGLAVWRGVGGFARLDLICLGVALAALGLWKFTDIPLLMLLGSVVADVMAVVPTVLKALRDPYSEDGVWFACSAGASLCGLLAVGRWDLTVLFYPAYLFVANLATALVIWVGQYHSRRAQKEVA